MILNQGANNFLRTGLFRQAVVHIGRRVSTNAGIEQTLTKEPLLQMDQRFQEFQLRGKVFAVTGEDVA
jgi:hypothetical protein